MSELKKLRAILVIESERNGVKPEDNGEIALLDAGISRIAALEAAIKEHKLVTQELCLTEDFDTALYNALNTESK